ncbi:MAG TPA: L,D-transpeptidase [Candidatus Krumholzibacteria bacterium]|nr:L,D-transpeptidase [Candidatus Krumholzibacteria bacterium]HPD72917.1 L,D-transpeptidase [Candidatus Krumholzibacteria bacterium]HRY41716.1 L,D-transpeptidase [Candidatus Krumholzibacteria bacterium]
MKLSRWRLALLVVAVAVGGLIVGLQRGAYRDRPGSEVIFAVGGEAPTSRTLAKLDKELDQQRPRGVYLTVDTVANKLQVRRGGEVLRDATCSAGTGSILEDPKTGKRWVFDTPHGIRTVREKKRNPVWTRPDWSYVESGEDLPARWTDRRDHNVLGDWALYLGDGYMIHGTLFQRYLGRNVTHGCIRLGDDDLEFVAKNTPIGASVLLF